MTWTLGDISITKLQEPPQRSLMLTISVVGSPTGKVWINILAQNQLSIGSSLSTCLISWQTTQNAAVGPLAYYPQYYL